MLSVKPSRYGPEKRNRLRGWPESECSRHDSINDPAQVSAEKHIGRRARWPTDKVLPEAKDLRFEIKRKYNAGDTKDKGKHWQQLVRQTDREKELRQARSRLVFVGCR
jgi:hypothetical protein